MTKLRLIKTGLGILIMGAISSCSGLEAKICSGSCKNEESSKIISSGNMEIIKRDSTMNKDSMKVKFSPEDPLVCKMTGPEQAKRKESLQKEIFSQAKKIKETEFGYIFYFKYNEDFLMKMADYVITENNCCPFLTFDIKLHSKDDVKLTISGTSEEAKEMIRMTLIEK